MNGKTKRWRELLKFPCLVCLNVLLFALRSGGDWCEWDDELIEEEARNCVFPPADVMQLTCQHAIIWSEVDVMQSPFSVTLRLMLFFFPWFKNNLHTTSFQIITKHESFYHYQQLSWHSCWCWSVLVCLCLLLHISRCIKMSLHGDDVARNVMNFFVPRWSRILSRQSSSTWAFPSRWRLNSLEDDWGILEIRWHVDTRNRCTTVKYMRDASLRQHFCSGFFPSDNW